MINKQKKWIALLVVCTFVWLLQVSAMPLPAAETAMTAASSEQGTDYYEAIGQKAAPAKKKSILPFVLIGLGLVTVTAVVLFMVMKGYDITGSWTIDFTWQSGYSDYTEVTFTGSKKSGTFYSSLSGSSGTYAVDGKDVSWTYESGTKYTGKFTGKKSMSGTMLSYEGSTGTWTATKDAETASLKTPLAASGQGAKNDEGK